MPVNTDAESEIDSNSKLIEISTESDSSVRQKILSRRVDLPGNSSMSTAELNRLFSSSTI